MSVTADTRKIILNFIMVLTLHFHDHTYFSYDLHLTSAFFFKVVNTKPVITKPPMPITVNPETDVHLNCTATGTPQPDIRWEHKGVTVGYSVLTIENIQKSGNYTCIAENSVGSSRASTSVTVRSKS